MIPEDFELSKGDILVKREGWSMVIYDFYEIVDITNKQVKLRELKKEMVNIKDCMSFDVKPTKEFNGNLIIRVSKNKLRIQYSMYNSTKAYTEDHAD